MNYLVIWIREGRVEAVRRFQKEAEADWVASAWAGDPENRGMAAFATLWHLKRGPIREYVPDVVVQW